MKGYALRVLFLWAFLANCSLCGGEDREVLRKEYPDGSRIRAVVRVAEYKQNIDPVLRAAVENRGLKLLHKDGDAEFRIIYFTPAGSSQEVVARNYFVRWMSDVEVTDGDEKTYMKEFRTLDLAVSKDRLEILAHSRQQLWLESIPINANGRVAERGTVTTLVDRDWPHRHDGYLPVESALLKTTAEGSSVLITSDVGKRVLWDVVKGVCEMKWME